MSTDAYNGESRRSSDRWLKLISPISVLLIWEAGSRLGAINALFLPPPSLIAETWAASFLHGSLGWDIVVSLKRLLLGFTLGTAIGLGVAMIMIIGRGIRDVLDVLVTMVYPIPKVAILPLLLIWFGTGDLTRVLVIASGAFFPIVINVYGAAKDVDQVLIRAARNLGASDKQLLRHVIMPAILPSFYAGAILGGSLSLVLMVYAEMTAANSGIGYFTYTASTLFEPEKAFAGVFTLGVLGWLWHKCIVAVRTYHCPWQIRLRS